MNSEESYLKAKAAEENAALGDDGRRRQIGMLEISEPPIKTDHRHYWEDQHKLGKNLKCIHKAIIKNLNVFDLDLISQLKVYGYHIYGKYTY
jgi:hypothetical protein